MFGNRVFSKIAFVLTLSLVWFGISESAWAQFKLLSKIIANPTETDNPLIFDVNNVSDDNISPNIILSADGKRGFVAYTGVGEIVEFSLEKGEILKRIPTEGTPSAATRLPNDRIAFVSVFRNKAMGEHDNRIFVVDMNTSSLVTTYEFTNAAFGFGSIIELAPDGTTGFVSSTGTGEVIKFDVNDGHEIGRMRNMRHPAQITVTPDGATIIVIDVDQLPSIMSTLPSSTRRFWRPTV
jgi:DNA-binding beta-propeller fold protein YncE